MWISTKAYLASLEDSIKLRLERDAAVTQLKQQETTMNWLMVRLTQLEHERAQMLWKYMGVKITVPTVEAESPSGVDNAFNRLPSFDDVGDEVAAKEGISWDEHGGVTYGH